MKSLFCMCGLSEGFDSSVVEDSWCVLVCDLKMFEIVCLQGEVKIVFAVIVFIMLEIFSCGHGSNVISLSHSFDSTDNLKG